MSLLEVPGSEVFSKGSPITAMVVVKGKSRFDLMPARNLRIVKRDLGLMLGICKAATNNSDLISTHPHKQNGKLRFSSIFDRHTCKTLAERLGIMGGSRGG